MKHFGYISKIAKSCRNFEVFAEFDNVWPFSQFWYSRPLYPKDFNYRKCTTNIYPKGYIREKLVKNLSKDSSPEEFICVCLHLSVSWNHPTKRKRLFSCIHSGQRKVQTRWLELSRSSGRAGLAYTLAPCTNKESPSNEDQQPNTPFFRTPAEEAETPFQKDLCIKCLNTRS